MELLIKSDTLDLKDVDLFVEQVLKEYGISGRYLNNVLVCVKEAVTNSIVHGNKFDVSKKVSIKVNRCHEDVYFRIKDEGEGFEYERLPDPTEKENLLKEKGRGIFLMKSLSDGVVFKERGKVILIKIKLCGDDKVL